MCGNDIVVESNCLQTTHPEIAKEWHPTFTDSFKSTPGKIENIKDVELTSIMDYFSIDTYIKASKNNYPYSGTVDYYWQRDYGSGVGDGGDYGFIYYLMGKYIFCHRLL